MGTAYASVRFEHSPLWSNASLAAEFECTDARVTVSHTTITCDVPPMYNADVGPFTTNLTLQYTAIVQIDNQVSACSSPPPTGGLGCHLRRVSKRKHTRVHNLSAFLRAKHPIDKRERSEFPQ